MSALADVVAAAEPSLAPYAVDEPGEGELERIVGEPRRAFVVEAIREGYLMHHREPRAFAGMDPDLRLLAGDALYALGLDRLAAAGDLEAIAELSNLIALSARAEAEGRREAVDAAWRASAELLSGRGRGAAEAAPERPEG